MIHRSAVTPDQLSFTVIPATAFAHGTTEQREQWLALIATMESTLRLHKHRACSLVALDECLYRGGGGMIGSLSQLIRGAAILAIEDGHDRISRDVLGFVPVDYAAERADTTRLSRGSGSGKRAVLGLSRLPIAVAPARQETVASYIARLAALHGLHPREIWEQVSTPRSGTARRDVATDRLAAVSGRPVQHLAHAMLELRDSAPDWTAWRHQTQPRCDARHEGGPVIRLLAHPHYVSIRHSYWIGPPDAGQPPTPLGWQLREVVRAQRRHLRLVRRHGFAAAYDAVLTGLLICGHLWGDQPETPVDAWHRWTLRAEVLIPASSEPNDFSASRLFAAVYPEAVDLGALIASPAASCSITATSSPSWSVTGHRRWMASPQRSGPVAAPPRLPANLKVGEKPLASGPGGQR